MERVAFSGTSALEGNTLSGVAHAFGQRTLRNGTWVAFAPGAFDAALRTSDVRAFLNHSGLSAGEVPLLLGRQSAGTVRLSAAPDGLHYAIDLPDTSYARDARVLVERGDLTEMSFGIMPGAVRRGKAPDNKPFITHTSVAEILDVSLAPLPAFAGTTVQLSSAYSGDESPRSQVTRARARVRKGVHA